MLVWILQQLANNCNKFRSGCVEAGCSVFALMTAATFSRIFDELNFHARNTAGCKPCVR